MIDGLLQAVEASDVTRASEEYREKVRNGRDPWEIHLSLFPVVQRVLNPPFFNVHLPKMYGVNRDLIAYLEKDEIPDFVYLEVREYARRPKLEKLPRVGTLTSAVSFQDVESAFRKKDWERSTFLMAAYAEQEGKVELARRLMLLGSGYLDESLGHSVSCTTFLLQEMMERPDQDPWPVLATIADFFCKAEFHTTPALRKPTFLPSDGVLAHHVLRATSGRGLENLHHTITLYAMERGRQFFNKKEEYDHMIVSWIEFLGDKQAEEAALDGSKMESVVDYNRFYETFSRLEANPVVGCLAGMITSQQGRQRLGRFIIKGLCDLYRGDYGPHFFTGLGSALWVMNRYWNQAPIAVNALFQYLDFFFDGMNSKEPHHASS